MKKKTFQLSKYKTKKGKQFSFMMMKRGIGNFIILRKPQFHFIYLWKMERKLS